MPGEDFDFGAAMDNVVESGEVKLGGDDTPSFNDDMGTPPAPAPEPSPSPAPTAPTPPAPEATYPKSWKPEHQEKWATLDPGVKAEILRREEDFHRGLEPLRKVQPFLQRFSEAVAPISDLVQKGADPLVLLHNFGQAHIALSNPQTAVQAFKSLMADYGVTAEQLAGDAPYVHPQVKALQDELSGIKSTLSTQEQAAAQARTAALREHLEAFRADPEHPHFDLVADDIATLLRGNPRLTLKDAYDKAVWAHPEARKALTEAAAKKSADAAAAAAQASKGSTRSSPNAAPATGATGTIDDTMNEVLRTIKSRP